MSYSPSNWFWIVGSNEARFWSSADCAYVSEIPEAWSLDGENKPTRIASEYGLSDVLRQYGLPGPAVSEQDVQNERDRRIAAGFVFEDVLFQSRIEDQKRISGAATLALMAIGNGATRGDMRWHGGTNDFEWIAADNSGVAMDAHTVLRFAAAAANWEASHIWAARALKNMTPIPADFATNDAYWT
jgi:hypothetical protein